MGKTIKHSKRDYVEDYSGIYNKKRKVEKSRLKSHNKYSSNEDEAYD